jgi:tetratricopeptide (TPR) repeat protein
LHQEDRISAIQHARAATALGNDDATVLATAAFVIALDEHDTTTALKLFDRALDLSSSNIFALNFSAITLAWMGRTDLATERAEQALRLSPFDTINCCWAYHALAIAHFHKSRYSDAAAAASSAIDSNPAFSLPRAVLVAALVRLGRVDEARAATQLLLEREPSFTIRGLSEVAELEPAVFRPLAAAWREVGLRE